MSEDTGAEATQENTDTSAQDAVAGMVTTETTTEATTATEDRLDFVLDKYRAEGRTEADAAHEQAKAYTELQTKLGGFTGAPEDYKINVSDELKEKGVEIADDDPILEEAFKMAKDIGMNQDGFDKMLDIFAMSKVAEQEASQLGVADEMKSLGNNAETRVNNLDAWGKANLPADLYDGFVDMAQSASAVKAMEQLISMTRNAPVSTDTTKATPGVSSEELKAMQFETDEHGNRKMQTSPEFKARFDKLAAEVWGSEEQRIIVG